MPQSDQAFVINGRIFSILNNQAYSPDITDPAMAITWVLSELVLMQQVRGKAESWIALAIDSGINGHRLKRRRKPVKGNKNAISQSH